MTRSAPCHFFCVRTNVLEEDGTVELQFEMDAWHYQKKFHCSIGQTERLSGDGCSVKSLKCRSRSDYQRHCIVHQGVLAFIVPFDLLELRPQVRLEIFVIPQNLLSHRSDNDFMYCSMMFSDSCSIFIFIALISVLPNFLGVAWCCIFFSR